MTTDTVSVRVTLQELGLAPAPYLYPAFCVSRWQGEHLLISGQDVAGISIGLDESGNNLRIPDPHRVGLCFRVEIGHILCGKSCDQRVEPTGRGRLAQEGLEFLTMTGVNLVKIKSLLRSVFLRRSGWSQCGLIFEPDHPSPLGGLIPGEVRVAAGGVARRRACDA